MTPSIVARCAIGAKAAKTGLLGLDGVGYPRQVRFWTPWTPMCGR